MVPSWEELGRRAREAAQRGDATFAVPAAASTVAALATSAADPAIRGEAQGWLARGAAYHELVRLAARAAVALDVHYPTLPRVYGPKAGGEVEPMLALWPSVLALPMSARLSERDLIELRAFPVHPLGVVTDVAWADGGPASPSEFLFHDLDHARFKVREDLLSLGIEIPDAYRDGSTLDPVAGHHRTILSFARGRIGDALWERAPRRLELARRLIERADRITDRVVSRAAALLLFEVIHEKSFPLEVSVLERELRNDQHLAKLRHKHAIGFFGAGDPGADVVAALSVARAALTEASL